MRDRDIQNQPDRTVLPPPESPFKGKIETAMKNSTQDWPQSLKAFRKALPTSWAIDHWRRHRLRHAHRIRRPGEYAGFRSDRERGIALYRFSYDRRLRRIAGCFSLHGAQMLHSVGFGLIPEGAAGFSGYNCMIPPSAASVLEILRMNGYGTAWIGKADNPRQRSHPGWPV